MIENFSAKSSLILGKNKAGFRRENHNKIMCIIRTLASQYIKHLFSCRENISANNVISYSAYESLVERYFCSFGSSTRKRGL